MENQNSPQFETVINIPPANVQMQTSPSSSDEDGNDDKVQLKVCYKDSIIKLILFISMVGEEFYYSYEGAYEFLLKYNSIHNYVNIEYFIQELKNINYLNIDENIAIFSFPLQLNFVRNSIKIVCTKEDHKKSKLSSQPKNSIIPFYQNSELLSKKIIELHNTCFNLEKELASSKMETLNLAKNSNYETTNVNALLTFDEPVVFGNCISSLVITFDREIYKNKIELPENLQNLKLGKENILGSLCICLLPTIKFPNTLVRVILFNLFGFNQYIDFKSMPNIKEICFEMLESLNQPIDVPDTVERLIMRGLPKFHQTVVIPDSKSIMFVDFTNNVFRPKVNNKYSNLDYKYITTHPEFLIKCCSQKEDVIKNILHWNVRGFRSFPMNKKDWIESMYFKSKDTLSYITFF
jgi:hypothetical protein